MVGLVLSFENIGLDLDRKRWQSSQLWLQLESLLVKTDIVSLVVIMYTALPCKGGVQAVEVAEYICKEAWARDKMNSSFSKCPAVPLPRCLRNCLISLRSSKTWINAQPRAAISLCMVKNNIVLSSNFVTEKLWTDGDSKLGLW